jgi:outer membrane immunogenic protein
MKCLWAAAISAASLTFSIYGVGLAADLSSPAPAPLYAEAPATTPEYNWSGFYVGGNAGFSWGNVDTALSVADGPTFPNCHFCDAPGVYLDIPTVQSAGSPAVSPNGFIGGGQFGYNWQASHLVVGLELDFDASDLKATNNITTTLAQITALGVCTAKCLANLSTTVSTDWLFTARPRLGYAWNQTLFYGTGGLAVTDVKFSQSYSDNINNPPEGNGIESASASKTLLGWTVGGGAEQALTQNWTVKAEYLYTNFGGFNAFGVLHDSTTGDFSNFSNSIGHLSSSTVRGGVNYKF